MGDSNIASGLVSTAMGEYTTASGPFSTAMGNGSQATAESSTAFGNSTLASGAVSTAFGNYTIADGYTSTAMGTRGSTGGFDHTFVYSDGSNGSGFGYTTNTAAYQFMARASGGFVFYTSTFDQGTAQSTGVYLSPGSGSWSALSDRRAKDNVQPIDGSEVLDRVVAMPLATWHYKAQDAKYRHMGPMAQDFYTAFHLGESDTGIDTIDADGVALAAIQGLNAKLIVKDKEIETLKLRVASLESLTGDIVEMKRELAALKSSRTAKDTIVALTSESSH